jgi:hypothetical protein
MDILWLVYNITHVPTQILIAKLRSLLLKFFSALEVFLKVQYNQKNKEQ